MGRIIMGRPVFEQTEGTYRQKLDYLLSNLIISEFASIGIWDRRHLWYIKENLYLSAARRQAEQLFGRNRPENKGNVFSTNNIR